MRNNYSILGIVFLFTARFCWSFRSQPTVTFRRHLGATYDKTSSMFLEDSKDGYLSKLLVSYQQRVNSHPYTTKMITAGLVGALGDSLIQWLTILQQKDAHFDSRRLLVFTAVSSFYIAPVIHVWFNWLNMAFSQMAWRPIEIAAAMTIVDQTVGALIITLGFFYAFQVVYVIK